MDKARYYLNCNQNALLMHFWLLLVKIYISLLFFPTRNRVQNLSFCCPYLQIKCLSHFVFMSILNSPNKLYRSHRNHSHWADLSSKLSQLLGLARTRGRGRLPLVAEERAGISRGSRGQNALKGHLMTTLAQFFHFLTTYLPQRRNVWSRTWTKYIDGFS